MGCPPTLEEKFFKKPSLEAFRKAAALNVEVIGALHSLSILTMERDSRQRNGCRSLVGDSRVKITAADFSPQPPPSTTSPTCPRRGAPIVMRKCLRTTSSPHSQLWQYRTVRTSPRAPPRKPVVMQLSNTELLDLMTESKGASRLGKVDQNDDAQAQPLPDPQFGLPGSPLTDPRLLESRNRHKARKARPSKEKSSFQSKLLKNPFGTYASTAHFSKLTSM